jgi:hypothetical protein
MAKPPSAGRQIGVLGLDDSVALALGKHLLARYLNAGLSADRPASGRRKGEVYFATDTHELSVWDGTAWTAENIDNDDETMGLAYAIAFGRVTDV